MGNIYLSLINSIIKQQKEYNMDINHRLPNNLNNSEIKEITSQLYQLEDFILNKRVEITTIILIGFLEKNYCDQNITIEVQYNSDQDTYYWDTAIELTDFSFDDGIYDDKERGECISDRINLPDLCKIRFYNAGKIEFVNNKEGRDTLLKYMLKDKWQEWKKEGEIMDNYENLSQNIPNKEITTKPKLKI